jgi:hypothetical protein
MKQLKLHSQNMKSIAAAIQAAGGSVDVLLSKEVLSFLETLAQNGVSLTAKFHQEPIVEDDVWIINTNTTERYPDTLKAGDYIEVEYTCGNHDQGIALEWAYSWNSNNPDSIVKYRKVNK